MQNNKSASIFFNSQYNLRPVVFIKFTNAPKSSETAYCQSKGYEVEDYPFQKRILGETNEYYDEYYDEDYFCYE